MDILYKNYEPGKNLEDIQAKLYSMNNNRQVTGDQIRERFENEKIDPKSVLYAFTADNKPLGYVQARDYPTIGQIHMGHPWTDPECPEEVKDKLFMDLFGYMKSRKTELSLRMSTRNNPKYEELAKEIGMKIDRNVINFKFDLDSLAKYDKTPYNYTIRLAAKEDIETILECRNLAYGLDPKDRNERMIEFLENSLKSGRFYLIFDGKVLLGACNINEPAENDETTNLSIGPVFTLLEKEEALVFLFENSLTKAKEAGWNKDHILIGYTDENDREMGIIRSISKSEEKIDTRYMLK